MPSKIDLEYTYKNQDDEHIFSTEILGFKLERTFTKKSFENIGDKDLGKLMIKAFKTFVVSSFRDNLRLKKSVDKDKKTT